MTASQFNLIDEPWIPITAMDNVSLKQLFSCSDYTEIGGNPIQKIALIRLLLAISQAACTPENEEECQKLGPSGLAKHCLAYLEKHRDDFWLYGEKPFLQMPKIREVPSISFSAVMPEIAYGNNAFIFETQKEKKLTSADKALLVVTLMGFALGDKKANQNISLTNGYKKKPTKKPGACLGSQGYLHSFILGLNVHETLWLNLFSKEQLNELAYWLNGLGIAPWERMPDGEDCEIARDLKESYLGRLVPLSRFCFLAEEGLHYSEGIIFSDHKEGGIDPSIGLSFQKKEREAVWVNPEKRPWRMIIAFLSYLQKSSNQSFDCLFISKGMSRAKLLSDFGIWSGGLRVSSKSGHQFFSGNDDFVESKIRLSQEVIGNSDLFWRIEDQIKFLDKISKSISTAVSDYYKQLKVNGAKHAQLAVNLFWQGCEKYAQELFQLDHSKKLRNKFEKLAFDVYDQVCHKGTSRQINSWAYNREKIKVSSK